MGYRVHVVSQSTPEIARAHANVTLTDVPIPKEWKDLSRLEKLAYYLRFRAQSVQQAKTINPDIIWLGNSDTAWLLLGSKVFQHPHVVLHNLEVYDAYPLRLQLTAWASRRVSRVVVCEHNRAYISKVLYGLDTLPAVLQNRPLERLLATKEQINPVEELIPRGKFIVLYQGAIMAERKDFMKIAEAVDQLGEDWAFVCIGPGDRSMIESAQNKLPSFNYCGYIPAPNHLLATRAADIGVVAYDSLSLNTAYCAPNKTWEYAANGVPMICADLPGLLYSVGRAGAGEVVDLSDIEAIKTGLLRIRRNRTEMSRRALEYYSSYDFGGELVKAISQPSRDLGEP
jgi:glycosyltransferase involved in cell wall biosynthesis